MSSPVLDCVMLAFTYAATFAMIWLVSAGGLMLSGRNRRAGIAIILTVVVSYVLCDLVLKPAFCRERPCGFADFEMLVPVPDSYSFPSGHTMSSFAVATLLVMVFGRKGVPALVFAAFVGISRMYLFVHWPTDVLAGMIFGTALGLTVSYALSRAGYLELEKGGAGAPEV